MFFEEANNENNQQRATIVSRKLTLIIYTTYLFCFAFFFFWWEGEIFRSKCYRFFKTECSLWFLGTLTSAGRIGERLSLSGTRLNTSSPVSGSANFKGSIESLKHADRTFGGTTSKPSIIDMVSSKIHRSKTPQVGFLNFIRRH